MPKIGEKKSQRRSEPSIKPYWATSDGEMVRLYLGNVTDVLAKLPPQSVHMCVTSPPYWGLRDYGTGTWEGGDSRCEHKQTTARNDGRRVNTNGFHGSAAIDSDKGAMHYRDTCGKCGAKRIDQQLGSEPSPDCGTQGQAQCGRCFVCAMVAVFRGVHRVLRDDGTLWLNLGDSYTGGGGFYPNSPSNKDGKSLSSRQDDGSGAKPVGLKYKGLPASNLIGVPWRVALALQADGWILRQDIIWHKPSPMPESIRNRCTKAHEYVFLFAKAKGYYYDAEAIKEKSVYIWNPHDAFVKRTSKTAEKLGLGSSELKKMQTQFAFNTHHDDEEKNGRNKRSVWNVSSQGYVGAHFATFPPKLIEPMIKAGTSEKGCCAKCGAPWKRIVEEKQLTRERPNDYVKRTGNEGTGNSCANSVAGVETKTVGWEPQCECDAEVIPCTVLDPFIGSGTTCCVSLGLGRRSVGIDLSENYLRRNAVVRIEGELMSRPKLAHLTGRQRKPIEGGIDLDLS